MSSYRESKWGMQVMVDKVGAFEVWETVPARTPCGGRLRKVGEQVEVDSVIYTVTRVTPSSAIAKETKGKVVKFTTIDGEEIEYKARGRGEIRISSYRYE